MTDIGCRLSLICTSSMATVDVWRFPSCQGVLAGRCGPCNDLYKTRQTSDTKAQAVFVDIDYRLVQALLALVFCNLLFFYYEPMSKQGYGRSFTSFLPPYCFYLPLPFIQPARSIDFCFPYYSSSKSTVDYECTTTAMVLFFPFIFSSQKERPKSVWCNSSRRRPRAGSVCHAMANWYID